MSVSPAPIDSLVDLMCALEEREPRAILVGKQGSTPLTNVRASAKAGKSLVVADGAITDPACSCSARSAVRRRGCWHAAHHVERQVALAVLLEGHRIRDFEYALPFERFGGHLLEPCGRIGGQRQ